MNTTGAPSRRTAFTLAELLIVIGVISILSVFTLVSIQAITRDARCITAS